MIRAAHGRVAACTLSSAKCMFDLYHTCNHCRSGQRQAPRLRAKQYIESASRMPFSPSHLQSRGATLLPHEIGPPPGSAATSAFQQLVAK